MKKILPVTLETGITTETWTVLRLAVVLANPRLLPWFYENFIQVHLNQNFSLTFCNWLSPDTFSLYDEILDFQKLDFDGPDKDLISLISHSLQDNRYVLVSRDAYYIPGSKFYQKEHDWHDLLIFGIDTDQKEFHFIDVYLNGRDWDVHTISYTDLEASFVSSLALLEKGEPVQLQAAYMQNMPLTSFKLKDFERTSDVSRIFGANRQYLNGGEYKDRNLKNGVNYSYIKYSGISIYDGYHDMISRIRSQQDNLFEKEPRIIWGLKKWHEHKVLLMEKIKYLRETYKELTIDNLLDDGALLASQAKKMYTNFVKYSIVKKEKFLEKNRVILDESKQLEVHILQTLNEELCKLVTNDLLKYKKGLKTSYGFSN